VYSSLQIGRFGKARVKFKPPDASGEDRNLPTIIAGVDGATVFAHLG
jgi:hypothetical protein